MIFRRLAAFAVVVVVTMFVIALIINDSLENKFDRRIYFLEKSNDSLCVKQQELAYRTDPQFWQLSPIDSLAFCNVTYKLSDWVFRERLQSSMYFFYDRRGWLIDKYELLGRYQPFIESALLAEGLPTDLEYLFIQESGLDPIIESWAKAAGLSQFIVSTARQFHLTVNSLYDERKNPIKSVKAACKYLKVLYSYFDNWPLALASYNHGENAIRAKLKQQGVKDFIDLSVPRETYYYVFRIMALSYIYNRDVMHLKSWVKQMEPLPYSREEYVNLKKTTRLIDLSLQLSIDYDTLRLINPHLHSVLPAGKYPINKPI